MNQMVSMHISSVSKLQTNWTNLSNRRCRQHDKRFTTGNVNSVLNRF